MALPTTYDGLISKYRGQAPLAFIKALIRGESGFRPSGQTGSYRGLMQVGPSVLKDYNSRHGSSIAADQLFDPETCIKVGCETIGRIVSAYDDYRTLQPDWSQRYATLVMFGWNAGYSKGAGVQYVVGVLEGMGYDTDRVTIDSVYHAAAYGLAPKAASHLANAAKVSYCKKVGRWYSEESGLSAPSPLSLPFDLVDDALMNVGIGEREKAIGAILAGILLLV